MKLAIIGTAGRGDDAEKLTPAHWEYMVAMAYAHAMGNRFHCLVSGGAAWADHVAVELVRRTEIDFMLDLHLPRSADAQETAAKYHAKFSRAIGREDTAQEVRDIIKRPLVNLYVQGGFKDRNTRVAKSATHFLAMTFGDGARVKDGGTKDTVDKMLALGKSGWHLDLHTMTLHEVCPQ